MLLRRHHCDQARCGAGRDYLLEEGWLEKVEGEFLAPHGLEGMEAAINYVAFHSETTRYIQAASWSEPQYSGSKGPARDRGDG